MKTIIAGSRSITDMKMVEAAVAQSGLDIVRRGKRGLLRILLLLIITALLLIAYNLPKPNGIAALFTMHTMPASVLVAVVVLIAGGFLLLVVHWYDDRSHPLDLTAAVTAFLGGGLLAMLIADLLLYPAWHAVALMGSSVNVAPLQLLGSGFAKMEPLNGDAGPVEELAKMLALLLIPSVRICIDDGKSGALYAVLCALGFAMIENISYLSDDASSLWGRITPVHAVFSVIWGYALGLWINKKLSAICFTLFLLLAMGLHAAWNIIASLQTWAFILLFALAFWPGLWLIRRLLGTEITPPSLHT